MAVYAIGDVQGCYSALRRLLDALAFDPNKDRLWFTGDLVNRGPESLQVLRFVVKLGENAITVLGNHDLHLLAVAAGVGQQRRGDTLDDILTATDRDDLLDWLAQQPLLHRDAQLGWTLVHAGFLPQWDLQLAQNCAREVEAVLQGPDKLEFFQRMYGNQPARWDSSLVGWDRLRLIINAFTRLRFCTPDGSINYSEKGAPAQQSDLIPWFAHPLRRSQQERIVFGHWSTLGICHQNNVVGLDSGCVWGGELTAVRLDGLMEFVGVSCPTPA